MAGMIIEPNPKVFGKLTKERLNDTNINCGINNNTGNHKFTVLMDD